MYSNELVSNILLYIDNNINNKISIDDLASNFNYNRYHIMKLFKKELNISIVNYINILKVYNSLSYINSNRSFLSCALYSGFNSLEYYSEMFKKILGINPRIYKKIIKRENISNKYYDIFAKSFSHVKSIINYCNDYKYKVKPETMPVKKLSIF